MSGIIYAIYAGVAFGLWIFFHKLASINVSQVLGAILVSAVAVIGGLVILTIKGVSTENIQWNYLGIAFLCLAGLSALSLDVFTLKTFNLGIPISVGGPIIIGLSLVVPVLLGLLFLGEALTILKLVGISCVLTGSLILARL